MKQIIAMGGGRFSNGDAHALLESYLLQSIGKPNPAICFLATASGDSPDYLIPFYSEFGKLNCKPTSLSLIYPETAEFKKLILAQDIVYVGGGNTKNMLALWKEWGLDSILREAYEEGILLAGWSAGAICWFEQGLTDSIPGTFTPIECQGFLPGSCCPHYDGESERQPVYRHLIQEKKMKPGIAIEDAAALHFINGRLAKVVCAKPESKAYAVNFEKGFIAETELIAHYLGKAR